MRVLSVSCYRLSFGFEETWLTIVWPICRSVEVTSESSFDIIEFVDVNLLLTWDVTSYSPFTPSDGDMFGVNLAWKSRWAPFWVVGNWKRQVMIDVGKRLPRTDKRHSPVSLRYSSRLPRTYPVTLQQCHDGCCKRVRARSWNDSF